MRRSLKNVTGVVLLLHVVALLWHDVDHLTLPVHLHAWQLWFVVIVVTVLPILGWLIIAWGGDRLGSVLFGGSMLGAFLFGVYFHMLVPNPDHVLSMPDTWAGRSFQISAVVLALLEGYGAWVGLGYWLRGGNQRSASSTLD